ncbi:protein SLOW GREEN 1, chloroplastic [Ancistrocladus abbreviatus]
MDSTLPKPSSALSCFHKACYSNLTLRPPKYLFIASKNLHNPPFPFLNIRASSSSINQTPISSSQRNDPIAHTLKNTAKSMVLTAAAALMIARFNEMPAKAESPTALASTTTTEDIGVEEGEISDLSDACKKENGTEVDPSLTHLLESNSELVVSLKSLLQQKLENGEDEEALKILQKLVSAQPKEAEWKFLMARLLSEMGNAEGARKVFEEILAMNPLSFEALFENALLMDQCGERDEVMGRLEKALRMAEEENKAKEARDVRLIMAQMQFLQKNIDEALRIYDELVKEDPKDFRPYFCKGMIYSLLDRNIEAREQFAKYRELSPKKFEVEGYLRTSLSRMKLFGGDDSGKN